MLKRCAGRIKSSEHAHSSALTRCGSPTATHIYPAIVSGSHASTGCSTHAPWFASKPSSKTFRMLHGDRQRRDSVHDHVPRIAAPRLSGKVKPWVQIPSARTTKVADTQRRSARRGKELRPHLAGRRPSISSRIVLREAIWHRFPNGCNRGSCSAMSMTGSGRQH